MLYSITGRLHSAGCDSRDHLLPNTPIKLYALQENAVTSASLATAQPKEVARVLSEKEQKSRSGKLLGQTTTDDQGNFSVRFDDGQVEYVGGPVEIVLDYDQIPDYGQGDVSPHRGFEAFEVLIDVFQPKWRETDNALIASYQLRLTQRVYCDILARLDIWVICGTLLNCESQQPLPGIEVIAMDDDVITDDLLGSATTDANGRFCIFYRSKDFKKTFLSPIINVETPIFPLGNGPDVYFKYAVGGSEFFAEDPSEAQKTGRKNVSNCLCVSLCLDEEPGNGGNDYPTAFYHIGYARQYHPVLNIDPATGRTTGKANGGWNNKAFYDDLDLRGSLTQKMNGQPAEYLFQYAEVSDPSVPVSSIPASSWTDVTPGDVAPTVIGTRITQLFPVIEFVTYGINDPSADFNEGFNGNWIIVPQYTGLPNISFNGSLIKLISANLAGGFVDKSALVPGNSSAPLEINRYFALRMKKREAGNPASEVDAGFSRPIAIFNTIYQDVPQGGSWAPAASSDELGIATLDLQELVTGGGCGKITDSLTVNYTAANPNLGNLSLSMSGPGGPHNFEPVAFTTPGEEAHGTSLYTGANNTVDPNDVANLPNCAFEIRLNTTLHLTNGENNHPGIWDRVLFCK
ncbi:MAG: hypothetical protein WBG71_06330 [Leeuwenhoekiella sp.]